MSKPSLITPRTLKGFRDYLPAVMIPREQLIQTAREVYQSYGFLPIDTPALEYLEILTGKGSDETDKQLYRFQDHGGRDVGLRFDLTVPLARFASQYAQQLGLPFKRYHIATVWRGENTQRGRYREFMQCDFDTVGTTSVASDIETLVVVNDLMQALGFDRFVLKINNRAVLNGLLEKTGLADQSTAILRALDKLAKIGAERVAEEMQTTAGATSAQAEQILELVQLSSDSENPSTNDELLNKLEPLVAGVEVGEQGVARLREILAGVAAAGVPDDRVKLDVSIARGLDYYTGLVVETFLSDLPEIGSVASGGRYDNLAGLYTKQALPGIGASLGLDRLLAAMETLEMLPDTSATAPVLLTYFEADRLADYLRLASQIRQAGIAVELYPEPKKLGKQLQYADKRGFQVALIAGSTEFAAGECQLKHLATGESQTASLANEAEAVISMLQEILTEGR